MAVSAIFSGLLNIVRLSLYVFLLICGLIVLGLSADIASDTGSYTPDVVGYLVFLGVFTLITVVPFGLILPLFAPAAFVSQIRFELCLLCLLWIFWLAGAGAWTDRYANVCDFSFVFGFGFGFVNSSGCSRIRATTAFTWLGWIALTVLLGMLVTLASLAHNRGRKDVWSSNSVDYSFRNRAAAGTTPTMGEANLEKGAVPATQPEQVQQPLQPHQVEVEAPISGIPPAQETPRAV